MNSTGFGRWGWLLQLLAAISLILTVSDISAAATINGTVTTPSGKTGRVFLSVEWQGGGDTGFGVSIPAAGAFTIRGIQQNGDYIVRAFQDTQGSGIQHANDPVGASAQFNFTGTDVSSVAVPLDNPSPAVGLLPPTSVDVVSGDQGALIMWEPATSGGGGGNGNGNGKEIAKFYKVYWSTSPDPKTTYTTNGGSSPDLPSNDKNVFMTALSNGPLYVAVTAKLGVTESAPTNANGGTAITIGAPAGGVTVSGTIISSGVTLSATTPLWIALAPNNGPPVYIASKIATPSNIQPYTITGVQPGTYQIIAILDMNNSGVIDLGDIENTESSAQPITVDSVAYPNANVTLVPTDVQASIRTNHWKQDIYEGYSLNFDARMGRKRPVNIAISGPQLSTPIDMGLNSWGSFSVWPNVDDRPTLPATYSFAIGYSDGTTTGASPLTADITGIVDSFATPTSPVGYITYPFSPTDFTWSAPPSPPTPYTYSFWLNNVQNFNSDDYSNLPSSTSSVPYTFAAIDGTRYDWSIAVVDNYGNSAQSQTSFTATSSPAINSFTPTSALIGATITINGINFDLTALNNTVYFCGASAQATTASATQLQVIVPANACSGSLQVNANGTTSSYSSMQLTILKTDTTTGVVSNTNPSTYGQGVIFTANVAPVAATGSIQFFDGGISLGTAPVIAGSASLPISNLTTGAHSITAIYNGDTSYNSSASAGVTQTVNGWVKIGNNGNFLTLQTAVTAAVNNDALLLRDMHFAEDLIVSWAPPVTLPITITLMGGLASDFITPAATATSVRTLKIRQGKIIANRLVVKPD